MIFDGKVHYSLLTSLTKFVVTADRILPEGEILDQLRQIIYIENNSIHASRSLTKGLPYFYKLLNSLQISIGPLPPCPLICRTCRTRFLTPFFDLVCRVDPFTFIESFQSHILHNPPLNPPLIVFHLHLYPRTKHYSNKRWIKFPNTV